MLNSALNILNKEITRLCVLCVCACVLYLCPPPAVNSLTQLFLLVHQCLEDGELCLESCSWCQ